MSACRQAADAPCRAACSTAQVSHFISILIWKESLVWMTQNPHGGHQLVAWSWQLHAASFAMPPIQAVTAQLIPFHHSGLYTIIC